MDPLTRPDDRTTQAATRIRSIHATPSVNRAHRLSCCLAIAYFILAGIVFIPYAGIQNDEALFAAPLYGPFAREFRIRMFHTDIPVMLMSYLGTLKTWLFYFVFSIWRPGVWSLRLPMVILSAVSIGLFWRLLDRSAGRTAAWIGCVLLATDASFLLTSVFDWGPVVLQHLCLVAGTLVVLRALQNQDHSRFGLGLGFAFLGLGMWDKALFSWTLGGLAIATLIVFPPELKSHFTIRNLRVAALGFVLGALPLVIYNVRNPLATFAGNARFSTEGVLGKAYVLRSTADGSSLFGYLTGEDDSTDHPSAPRSPLERASTWVRSIGEHRKGLTPWLFAVALLAAPLWWGRRRPVLFGLIFIIVAWAQMAFTKDAGGSAHHAVLLWPFPYFVIAAALAAAAERVRFGRATVLAVTVVVALSNVLVANQYLSQFIRNGAGNVWTDALGPLSAAVPERPDQDVFAMDWGMFDSLQMLHRGRIKLWIGSDAVSEQADRRLLGPMLARKDALFLTFAAGHETIPGTRDRLNRRAVELGYQPRLTRTIADRNGRSMFEVWQFSRPENPTGL